MKIKIFQNNGSINIYRRISFTLVLIIAIVFLFFIYFQISQREDYIRNSLKMLREQYTEFEMDFRRKAVSLGNFVGTIDHIQQSEKETKLIDSLSTRYLTKELQDFEFALGMGFVYTHNFNENGYSSQFVYNDKNGLVSRMRDKKWKLCENYYNLGKNIKLRKPLKKHAMSYPMWTSPFRDSLISLNPIMTIYSPIYSDNRKHIGTTFVDLDLKLLKRLADETKPTVNSEFIIMQLSSNKILGYSIDSTWVMQDFSKIDWLEETLLNTASEGVKYKTINTHDKWYRLYLVNVSEDFIFGFLVPYQDYHTPLIIPFLFTMLGGVLIVLFLHFLIRNSINTITRLNDDARRSNAWLELLMNSVPDIIILMDEKGNFLDVNDTFCSTFDYKKNNKNPIEWHNLVADPQITSKIIEYFEIALKHGYYSFECDFLAFGNKRFTALVRFKRIITGKEIKILSVLTDMTEIKMKEKEISNLNLSLELKVVERTRQFEDAMLDLEGEIKAHQHTEQELLKTNEELLLLNETIANDSVRLIKLNDTLAQSEKKLQEANNAKDKFISILAHDIKNPMHAIIISSEFLLSEAGNLDLEQTITIANTIHKSMNNISNLLDDLLMWSRSQSGRMGFSPINFNLNDAVNDTTVNFKHALERKKICLKLENTEGFQLFADKNMFSTIARNLISNAIKFSNENSTINIKVNANNTKYIEVSFADEGKGIKPEDLPKLFRYDLSFSTKGTDKESGTGLGLLLCKEFMDRHLGEITLKSEVDKGTTFTLRFPKNS